MIVEERIRSDMRSVDDLFKWHFIGPVVSVPFVDNCVKEAAFSAAATISEIFARFGAPAFFRFGSLSTTSS